MGTRVSSAFCNGTLRNFGTLLLSMLILACAAWGQSTSTIAGTVHDDSGAAIAHANIVATNEGTGIAYNTQTDEIGNYQITGLPVGTYRVEVSAANMQKRAVTGLAVNVARNVAQNFTLNVASKEEVVTVNADAAQVEASTMTVGQVITEQQVQNIPLNGRHFVDLGLLVPGSVTAPQAGFLTAPLRGQGSAAFNTAGQREDTVNYMINGVNLNDMSQNQITFQPSINTVSEFKVDNQTYSAEFGRNSGAIVNIATRSGNNTFHGEGFDYVRNEDLDARNYFQTVGRKAPFHRNNFGVSVGGPVIKDKTFFFFSYEGTRQRQSVALNTNVLTAAERAAVTDPISTKLLAFIPQANIGANGFSGIASAPVDIDQYTIDMSHHIGPKDELHGYYAHQHDKRKEPNLQGNNVPGFGDAREGSRQIGTFNEIHTFGPTVVNEARLGFNRIFITFAPLASIDPASVGLGSIAAPSIPQFSISSVGVNFGGPGGFPQGRGDTTFVLSDTLSWLKGNHSFHFGGEFRRFNNNNFTGDTGTAAFANAAAFASGTVNLFTITPGTRPSRIFTSSTGAFFQDSWKIKPTLTLELGLRWDWNGTPTEAQNRFVVFDKASGTLKQLGSGIDEVYQQNVGLVQPRLGFAWDIFGDSKNVLRGGYAIAYDQPVTNSVSPLASNPPLAFPLTTNVSTQLSNLGSLQAGAGTLNSINPDFSNPYVQSYNLNIQRQLSSSATMMVGYFGSKATHLRISENVNQKLTQNGPRPFTSLVIPGSGTVIPSNITEIDSAGNSNYNALWISLEKHMSKGLQFSTSYTLSKSLDYNSLSSSGISVQDSLNLRGDYGPSDFDARHRVIFSGIWQLPFHGNRLKDGWQISNVNTWQTGNPIANLFASNANGALLTGLATLRPDVLQPIHTTGNPAQWFANPVVCDPRVTTGASLCTASSVFALPVSAAGAWHFGNLRRGAVYGPGFTNTDLSLVKRTKITERFSHELRIEAFDLFNHPNFGQPGRLAAVASTSFGTITSTRFPTGDSGSARQMQIAMKLTF
jgi:Carboxypeptidase regulatory-like domain/TonB dependent receptor